MEITNVSVEEEYSLVPVKGWGGVVNALNLYVSDEDIGATAAQGIVAAKIKKASGMMASLAFLFGNRMTDQQKDLVRIILSEARKTLKKHLRFEREFDYDGGERFFKTKITIQNLDQADMYAVGIIANGDDTPEIKLAEHLGVSRILRWCTIRVETNPVNNRFEFDFEQVLRRLDGVLDTKEISGKQVAEAMLEQDEHLKNRICWNFIIPTRDGLEVCIYPERVDWGLKTDPNSGRVYSTCSLKGSVLSGELERDWLSEDESAKVSPAFMILLTPAKIIEIKPDSYDRELIWEIERQKRVVSLANQIATALK